MSRVVRLAKPLGLEIKMYINFWYPVARSEEVVDNKPLPVKIFGLPLVAFRDTVGEAHVLSDTCVHRGGALSAGLVCNGRAICPYHGWEFSGDGTCKKIPSLADETPPARAKVDSYPVRERYGIVFAFMGDLPEEERPSIVEIPEFGDEGWKGKLYVLELKCNIERSIENGLDPTHNEFVHTSQGSPTLSPNQLRRPLPVEDIPWGSKFRVVFPARKHKHTALTSVRRGERVGAVESWFRGPNHVATLIEMSTESSFHQYLFEAPIDESNTRLFIINMRNWLLEDEFDERIETPTLNVLREDIEILERLNPIQTPSTSTNEILLPSDSIISRYREYLSAWRANGWRIDDKRLNEQMGRNAFAIPSPGRRKSRNWVLNPVPLIQEGDNA